MPRILIEGTSLPKELTTNEQCIQSLDAIIELITDDINTGQIVDENDDYKEKIHFLALIANYLETPKTDNNGI